MRKTFIALALGLAFAAQAQTPATKIENRFETFSGSPDNSHSLVTGLRTGGEITLVGSGETVTFDSPTKPMGYGNITRALDLAQRQLAAGGIKDPTPTELQAALTGGTITGPNGTVTYQGVLQMRADGMGWGQIAHAIGVHPGMGKGVVAKTAPVSAPSTPTSATAHGSSGIVTAGGGSPFSHANASGRALGRSSTPASTTSASAGSASAAGSAGQGAVRSAAAGGNGNAFGHSK